MHIEIQEYAKLTLLQIPENITEQLSAARAVFASLSTESLSDDEMNSRCLTLIDFHSMLNDAVGREEVDLPGLAQVLINLRIAPKVDGELSDESLQRVEKLIRAYNRVFDADQLSEAFAGIVGYAKRHDLKNAKQFLAALKGEVGQ